MVGISSVWGALSGGFAQYGIPYIDADNQPQVDPDNLRYDYNSRQLHLFTAGYFSPTYELSLGGRVASFIPLPDAGARIPGFYTWAPRGTLASPVANINADQVARFAGRGYANGAEKTFGGIDVLAGGGTAELGGYIKFFAKIDGSTSNKSFVFSPVQGGFGGLFPEVNNDITLGALAFGWKQFFMTAAIAGVSGNVTLNASHGRVQFGAGTRTLTLTNSYISATDTVMCTVVNDDATAFACKCNPANGSAVLALNANCTATTQVMFTVIKSDV